MKLSDIKKRVYSLLEELNEGSNFTDDEDFARKINFVIDQRQKELATIKKISAIKEIYVEKGISFKLKDKIADFYQLNKTKDLSIENFEDIIIPKETGLLKIYYYKIPKTILDITEDDYEIELDESVARILPYGVAGDLLKNDPSFQYGNVYMSEYYRMINNLDISTQKGVRIVGGVDV